MGPSKSKFLLGTRTAGIVFSSSTDGVTQSRDLASAVQVVWTPLGIGPELDTVAIVESMNETITPFDHLIRFGLSTVANRSPWTLEDDLLGALDGVAVLSF